MAIKCRIIRSEGQPIKVVTESGSDSILYNNLKLMTNNETEALKLYSLYDSDGFTETMGEVKLDENGEPLVEEILEYISDNEVSESFVKLDSREAQVVLDFLRSRNIEDTNTLSEGLNNIFKGGEIDTEALSNSVLFSDVEKVTILENKEVQNKLRSLKYKLPFTEETQTDTYLSDVILPQNTGERTNEFGLEQYENPFTIDQNIKETVADVTSRSEFDEAFQNIDNTFMIERFNEDQTYADKVYEEYKDYKSYPEYNISEDGTVEPKIETNRSTGIDNTLSFDRSSFIEDTAVLNDLTDQEWTDNRREVIEVLKGIEIKGEKAGIDLTGLSLHYTNQTQVMQFLDSLVELENNITQENLDNFKETYKNFFEVTETPTQLVAKNPEDGLVKINSNKSEYELFTDHGYLKIREGEYIQSDERTTEQIIDDLYNQALMGIRKFPLEVYEGDIQNEVKIKENISKYVEDNLNKMNVGTPDFEYDTLYNMFLQKVDRGVEIQPELLDFSSQDASDLALFDGGDSYINTDYLNRFQEKILTGKREGGTLYDNFYSKFEINEEGLRLKQTDPITINSLKSFAKENLPFQEYEDFVNYSLSSMDYNLRDVARDNDFLEPTPSKVENREYYKRNIENLQQKEVNYENVDLDIKVVEGDTSEFFNINGELFESYFQVGDQNFIRKVELEQGDIEAINRTNTINNVGVSQLNPYFRTKHQNSTITNKVSQKELKNITEENYDCA